MLLAPIGEGGISLRGQPTGGNVPELQRARISDAMARVVAERGFAGTSVELVIGRAGVSRRTFYELFAGLEDCFIAILDDGLRRSRTLILHAFAGEEHWRDGLRAGMAALLGFLDSEPELARLWLVDALAAGVWALEHRERNIAKLRTAIVSWWTPSASTGQLSPLIAEGVMASVLGVIHSHLVTGEREPLMVLLGPLMGIVLGPFVDAPTRAREVARGEALGRRLRAAPNPTAPLTFTREEIEVPDALLAAGAYRMRWCVAHLAENPGASNREIADGIGVVHKAQISTLLRRLQGWGLLSKRSLGPGKPNAWRLTPAGEQVAARMSVTLTAHHES